MMPTRNSPASAAGVKYSRLADSDEGYIDLQFKKTPPKVPYKAIALATFLFLIGSLLIIVGSLLFGRIHSGHVPRSNNSSFNHRHSDLSSRNLSPPDCLLCLQGIPWIFLWWHPRLWWLNKSICIECCFLFGFAVAGFAFRFSPVFNLGWFWRDSVLCCSFD